MFSFSAIKSFGPSLAVVLAGTTGFIQAQETARNPEPTQAQEFAVAPRPHSPVSIHRAHYDGTADSTNWSGYAISAANDSVTSVTGSWVVPAATCAKGSPAEYSAFWIGIDGWSSSTVEQIGTDSDCSNGEPSYYAWFEFYPQPAYYAGNLTNLTPGHVMSATISYSAATGLFSATITDLSQPSLTFTTTFAPSRRTAAPLRSSAEWIAEAPSSSRGVLPLANFGTVSLGTDYTSVKGTNVATINGVTGPIASFGSNVWSTTMINVKNDAIMAAPSSLTSDGTSFYVTWYSMGQVPSSGPTTR